MRTLTRACRTTSTIKTQKRVSSISPLISPLLSLALARTKSPTHLREPSNHVDHIRRLIHHDHSSRSQTGSKVFEGIEVHPVETKSRQFVSSQLIFSLFSCSLVSVKGGWYLQSFLAIPRRQDRYGRSSGDDAGKDDATDERRTK